MSRQARTKLALRAEAAFGLKFLAIPKARTAKRLELPAVTDKAAMAPLRAVPRRVAPTEPPPKPPIGGTQVVEPPALLIFDEPLTGPALSREEKINALSALDANEVKGCTKCRLCESRTHTVFGEGDPDASIFFIGEGPGENEDQQARPFVGRSGEMLNKWIAAMGLRREQVYIANIVKCRPPQNREPAADETATCTPYLARQLEIIRPKVIVTLGRPSAQHMLATKNSMGSLRGQWQQWRGIKLMPTYHPAYVLRNYTDATRRTVWNDFKLVMAELGLTDPRKSGAE